MKKLFYLSLALVMILNLSACSQSGTNTTSNNTVSTDTASSNTASTDTAADSSANTADTESATDEPAYKTIANVDGTEITVPTKVEKIGCLFGPSYEKVVVLGAEDKIVFDGDYHIYSWPWSNIIYKHVNDVPGIINAHSEPNIEDLVGYSPDIVFNFPNPTTTEAMKAAGMCVVPSASTGSYDDMVKTLSVYADAIGGDAPDIAKKYSDYFYNITGMIADRVSKVAEADRPTVYFANQEILKCSNKTDLIQRCGGVAVAAELTGGSAIIEKEQLLQWDPDYIFVDHAGSSGNATAEEVIAQMLADADYSKVAAVKNDNVIIVPTGVFFWDSGVQQPLMMLLLAKTMYPDLFSDVNMKDTLIDFYSQFFYYDLTSEQADMILAHLNPPQE